MSNVHARFSSFFLLSLLAAAPLSAQAVSNVTGNSNTSALSFAVSAPAQYGSAVLVYIKVGGKEVPLPPGGAKIGTNGTVELTVQGMNQGDAIEVGVTFNLANGSGGLSCQGSGTVQ
jgi:hypothetical protein